MDRRKVIIVTLTLIYAGIFYKFAFRPIHLKTRKLHEKLLSVKMQVLEMKKAVKKLADLEREVHKVKETLEKEEKKLYTREEVNDFVSSLAGLLHEKGLDVVSINLAGEKEGAPYPAIKLELFIRGDFRSMASFIADLEKIEKMAQITFFSMERVSLSPIVILNRLSLELRVKE
ncbi:type 4a pilus biogenesis protein PilO [Candidatus Calescamantes bacterium]|nr:type 4a pilus biogenesis protein PilO [Candidatus Calescamantes bacterium]